MDFKLPKGFVILFFVLLGIGFSYYYLIAYPKNIVTQANENLAPGENIVWSLDKGANFYQMLQDSKVKDIIFRDDKNKICGQYKLSEISKIEDSLYSNLFEKNACSKLCLNLIPSRVLRGSFCIYLDKNMKITNIEKPFFWINYASSKF